MSNKTPPDNLRPGWLEVRDLVMVRGTKKAVEGIELRIAPERDGAPKVHALGAHEGDGAPEHGVGHGRGVGALGPAARDEARVDAWSQALAFSAQVASDPRVDACRARAREAGYDLRVTLDAEIAFASRTGARPAPAAPSGRRRAFREAPARGRLPVPAGRQRSPPDPRAAPAAR